MINRKLLDKIYVLNEIYGERGYKLDCNVYLLFYYIVDKVKYGHDIELVGIEGFEKHHSDWKYDKLSLQWFKDSVYYERLKKENE